MHIGHIPTLDNRIEIYFSSLTLRRITGLLPYVMNPRAAIRLMLFCWKIHGVLPEWIYLAPRHTEILSFLSGTAKMNLMRWNIIGIFVKMFGFYGAVDFCRVAPVLFGCGGTGNCEYTRCCQQMMGIFFPEKNRPMYECNLPPEIHSRIFEFLGDLVVPDLILLGINLISSESDD